MATSIDEDYAYMDISMMTPDGPQVVYSFSPYVTAAVIAIMLCFPVVLIGWLIDAVREQNRKDKGR